MAGFEPLCFGALGDDARPAVVRAPSFHQSISESYGSTFAEACPLMTSTPSSSLVETLISTKCSPFSSRIASIVAVAVKVAPGNTCEVNRTP